jgi:hypothetical protein
MKTEEMLPPEELSLFMKLHSHLMAYTAQQTGVDTEVRTADDFIELSAEGKMKIRDRFLNDMSLLDRYVQSNPFGFSPEEMEIVSSWKHCVSATFFLIRITRDGAVFLEEKGRDAKAYLVNALAIPFEEILPFRPPVRLDAVLLPFRGKVVYDGLTRIYQIYMGGGMSRSLRYECDNAILKHGLVKSLPFTPEEKKEHTDEEKLLYYLKTKERREEHYGEIEDLLSGNPLLLPLYHREIGRANSRRQGDLLREVGIERGWFAIAGAVIIASGRTREEVQKAVDAVLPEDKRRAAFIFELG